MTPAADAVIRDYVERCLAGYTEDNRVYAECVGQMAGVKLRTASVDDVTTIVHPFLYRWGRMGRLLGQKSFHGWEGRLAKVIRYNWQGLKRYRTVCLAVAGSDLSSYGADIERLYEAFKSVLGRVGAPKALHLICPHFFPMWDNAIANGVRAEMDQRPATSEEVEPFSPADYYRFAAAVQDFIREHDRLLTELSKRFGRSKVKIVDDCFWLATKRPLAVFF